MRLVGVLGIVALLGCAYLMSNNRRQIAWRVVIGGMLLQLLFAGVILGSKIISYPALLIFLFLIIFYLYRNQLKHYQQLLLISGAYLLLIAILYTLATLLGAGYLGWFWLGLLLVILIRAFLKQARWQRELVSGWLLAGFCWMLVRGVTGQSLFQAASLKVERFLGLANLGAEFLFGNLAVSKYYFTDGKFWPGFGYQFAFGVLPVIIFFASFIAILYHLGIMQLVIKAMARFMQWTLGTSGAETLSCTANIFVGQTEAPLLIRPFLNEMTLSELLTVMVGGFATIAGGVLAGYIRMGVNAGHLIAASVMSAPAALLVGKIIFPETGQPKTAGEVEIPRDIVQSTNLLDAAARGVTDGLKLAANVAAMLVAFIALIGLIDYLLAFGDRLIDGRWLKGAYVAYTNPSGFSPITGEFAGFFPGSLKTLFGTLLRPLAWLMGVSWQSAAEVGNLLGIKLSLNEFVAYSALAELIHNQTIDPKAIVIATYALCGFANFASIGIQIGGISALAPERRSDLARVALKAMFGGAIASWITACIAGILL